MVCPNKNTFFFSLSCHHGSIYEDFGRENLTGIRNGDCNPRNGWGRQFDPKSPGCPVKSGGSMTLWVTFAKESTSVVSAN